MGATLPEAIAACAESQVGVHETTINGGPQIAAYQRATWLPVGPWPWCAAFVCWVIQRATVGRKVTFPRPMTAGAWDFEHWCRSVDNSARLRKPASGDIRRGDLVIYRFSHIGIATGPPDADGNFDAVEGNTDGAGSREGDGCWKKTRNISAVRSRIRFTV